MNRFILFPAISCVLFVQAGCGDTARTTSDSKTPPATAQADTPALRSLHPAVAVSGVAFNVQPTGEAALAVQSEGASSTTVIVFGERELKTIFGGPTLLSAVVPRELYNTPGSFQVFLKNGNSRSNSLNFEVRPKP